MVLSPAGAGAYTAWQQLQENRRQQQRNEELTREQLRQTFDASQEQLRLSRESQITERFTQAVEQLGSDKLDVRLAGIYALERIAKDSERDHPTVVEVLGAFVREGSRRHDISPPKQGMADEAAEKSDATAPGADTKSQPATDIQAALSVLGRLPQQLNVSRGDLTGAQVPGAWLGGANLSGARLGGAKLPGARLGGAKLSGARLGGAKLSGARLDGADLRQARELTQPQLDVARGDAKTQLPAGLGRPASWPAAAPPASPGPSPRIP